MKNKNQYEVGKRYLVYRNGRKTAIRVFEVSPTEENIGYTIDGLGSRQFWNKPSELFFVEELKPNQNGTFRKVK